MDIKIKSMYLKEMLKGLIQIVNETKMVFTDKGMQCRGVDPTHSAMIDCTLSKDCFEEYNVTGEESMGIDLDKLHDALKLSKDDDILHISLMDNKIIINNPPLKYRYLMLDISNFSEVRIPNITFEHIISLPGDQFNRGINAINTISENVKLLSDAEKFMMVGEGSVDSIDVMFNNTDLIEHEVSDTPIESLYSLEFLKVMSGSIPKKNAVTIKFNKDMPLEMIYLIAEGQGVITYLLAPRIEDND